MKKLIALTLLVFLITVANAQNRYLVYLADKGTVTSFNIEEVLSQRAIKNHQKNKVAFDQKDFPVAQNYIEQLNQIGSIQKTSKWLNAVVLESSLSATSLLSYSFVVKVEHLESGAITSNDKFKELEKLNHDKTLPYDSTLKQITQIGADCIHDKGYLADGVLLAVLDAGFQGMDTIPAFDSLYLQNRVIDKWDFIDNDTTVYEKHFHGTWVSSVITGYQTNFIGSAPHVNLALYITEDVRREVHEEEFDLVRGLERADSIGADLVNISLGYFTFDTLQGDYTYPDLDGQTTIAAQGIQMATTKGLVVVCSAGNSGPNYIGTPCDADSILCVGATDTNNVKASFSSVGPAADGRVKPDVSAIGRDAFCIDTDGTIRRCNGTSFSSPLTCGMVACLIQAHPTLTMLNIVEAVRKSASQFTAPDSLLGYGIPNACKADSLLDLLEITTVIPKHSEENSVEIYPNPSHNLVTINSNETIQSVKIYTLDGKLVKTITIEGTSSLVLNINQLTKGIYVLRINDKTYEKLIKN